MGSNSMKYSKCPASYSIICVQLMKHVNEMISFAKTFKWVSYLLINSHKLKHEATRNSLLILYIYNVLRIMQ